MIPKLFSLPLVSIMSNPILRRGGQFFFPLIMLFAFYIQFHGDLSPGGGFQAGCIFAAGYFLYALIFGFSRARLVLPNVLALFLLVVGTLLFVGMALYTWFLGGFILEYAVLGGTHAEEHGLFIIELGVGICVAMSMIVIVHAFVDTYRFLLGRS